MTDHNERRNTAVTLGMVAALMVAIVAGGLLVGDRLLSHDGDPPAPAAGTTTSTVDETASVEAAFRAFIAMVNRLDLAPDPQDPEIATRATGVTRAALEKTLARAKAKGSVVRTGPEDRQTVLGTMVEGNTATMRVCYVDHSGTFDGATGAVLDPMKVTTTPVSVAMARDRGVWKVSRVRYLGQPKEGASSCGL